MELTLLHIRLSIPLDFLWIRRRRHRSHDVFECIVLFLRRQYSYYVSLLHVLLWQPSALGAWRYF